MTMESAVVERLLTATAVADRVDNRVDVLRRSSRLLPSITLQVVSDPRPQHFRGFQSSRPSEVQVDVWAARPGEAAHLRDLAIAALTPAATVQGIRFQRAMITNIRSGFEPEEAGTDAQPAGELYRESIDFTFTHNAT